MDKPNTVNRIFDSETGLDNGYKIHVIQKVEKVGHAYRFIDNQGVNWFMDAHGTLHKRSYNHLKIAESKTILDLIDHLVWQGSTEDREYFMSKFPQYTSLLDERIHHRREQYELQQRAIKAEKELIEKEYKESTDGKLMDIFDEIDKKELPK